MTDLKCGDLREGDEFYDPNGDLAYRVTAAEERDNDHVYLEWDILMVGAYERHMGGVYEKSTYFTSGGYTRGYVIDEVPA